LRKKSEWKASHRSWSRICGARTEFGDPFDRDGTGFGVRKVLQALDTIPPDEKVAVYALGRKLHVIRESTADRASLEERLRSWKPSPDDAKTALLSAFPRGD
jgi:hypothetical protein